MPKYKLTLDDGRIIEATADSEADASSAAESWAKANPATKAKRKRTLAGEVEGAMANFNRAFIPGADESVAAAKTVGGLISGEIAPSGLIERFKGKLADQRRLEDEYAADRPKIAALSRGFGMAGAVAMPGGQAKGLITGSMAANAARGATTAGLIGAGYAAADRGTASERLAGASRAARDPVALTLGAAGGALATPRATRPAKPAKVNLADLKAQKTAAYSAADSAGVRYAPQSFDNLVAGIEADVTKANINATRHPKAYSMMEDLKAMRGQSPTLTELDQLRQVVRRDVAGPRADDAEKFFGRKMIERIDGFVDGAGPADVLSGSADDASTLINTARDLNSRLRKADTVEKAVRSAELRAGSTGSGGNVDNAMRQNLRRVFETTPNLTAQEKEALESIIMGGKGQNFLRQLGKLSPSGNGLMAAGNLASAAALGPLGAIPGVTGLVSKLMADGMTRRKIEELVQMMATGGQQAARTTGPAVGLLPASAAARAAMGAGVIGGSQASVVANP